MKIVIKKPKNMQNKKPLRISLIALAILVFLLTKSLAQMPEPVHLSFGYQQINSKEATLSIVAKIDEHWHIFSLDHKADIGLPIVITFNKDDKNYSLNGATTQPTPEAAYDSLTKSHLKYFSKEVTFKQNIKIKSQTDFQIKGIFTYQACNDDGCLPPTDVDFTFEVKSGK